MRDELGFETVLTAYGLTESTGTATMCRPSDDAETIANTSGCAIPDTEVRIVDDAGNEAARGEPGEVVVRGYNVMKGYFEDPEQTAETIDADGWLHTGDVGVMDERGYIRITDRKKDMFIVGGFNAYPAEIEGELLRHPSVAQAAVVGAPDERLGEVGVAFVVPRAGETIDPDEVLGWAREQMANYKVPRRIEIVDALPVNASGKVLKFELREQAAKLLSRRLEVEAPDEVGLDIGPRSLVERDPLAVRRGERAARALRDLEGLFFLPAAFRLESVSARRRFATRKMKIVAVAFQVVGEESAPAGPRSP